MIARRIRPTAAESSLASSFLAMLPTHAGNLGAAAEEIVADQALDLIAVSFAKAMESKPRVSSARSLALMNLRAAVEARLADPALDTETVAAAAGVTAIRECRACARGHVDHASHSNKTPGPLPAGAGRSIARPPDDQRNRLWLGIFRHDPLWPAVQGGLWFLTQGLSQA
jgi:hypothetical protein